MTRLVIYGIVLAVAGVVWLVQAAQAHGKRLDPATFRPVVGPIERVFLLPVSSAPQLIARAAGAVPGMSVAAVHGDVVYLNTRPHIGRLDDGAGLFVRVVSSCEGTRWRLRVEGQPKASLGSLSTASRGLASVERQLRQALAKLGAIADDGLAPVPGHPPPAPRALPSPTPSSRPFVHGASLSSLPPPVPPSVHSRVVLQLSDPSGAVLCCTSRSVAVGRDPVVVGGGDLLTVADPQASRTHAVLRVVERAVILNDLGSTNGTVVRRGGRDLAAEPRADVVLMTADVVMIGDQQLHISIGVAS